MRSPDVIAPDRLEELLRGAVPEGADEAVLGGLVRELRASAAPAPDALRARVAELRAPQRRIRPRPRPRRIALALAAMLVIAAVAGAIASSGGDGVETASAPGTPHSANDVSATEPAEEAPAGAVPEADRRDATALLPKDELDRLASGGDAAGGTARSGPAVPPLPPGGRASDVDLLIELRLEDANRLSAAANDAMQVTRDVGGYVRSSAVDTRGREGTARLALQVPVERVEEAVVRLSALGTITAENVAVTDLQAAIDRRTSRIEALRTAIRANELKLRSGTLSAEERLAVELQLVRQRATLRAHARTRAGLAREAAFAEVSLTLHTREASAAPGPRDESRIGAAARDAAEVLSRAGSIVVFVLIVLSPLLALAVLVWLAGRSRRRRADARLLEQPRPVTTPPAGPTS
jgi:Domain of unknown function (DUF4349)